MATNVKNTDTAPRNTAKIIRSRIAGGGERLWRFADFNGLPPDAVAQALSRLARQGFVQRFSKGVYYRSRPTAFGPSQPNRSHVQALLHRDGVFPAGVSAANLLGFTTQNPGRAEVATNRSSLSRLIVGKKTVVHTRRPEAWRGLSPEDAAFLDFLRNRGAASDLPPAQTVSRLIAMAREQGRLDRLLRVADSEPPRVRAMLGAIAEQIGKSPGTLQRLRHSLNPLSRFEFGILAALPHAGAWQSKERRRREAL